MAVTGLPTKMSEVHRLAVEAITNRLEGTGNEISRCILGIWTEPNGVVVLHLNSTGNGSVVADALWNRYVVEAAIHPEHGVLVWAA